MDNQKVVVWIDKRTAIVWVGIVLIVAMGMYPPVQNRIAHSGLGPLYAEFFAGYAWLFQAKPPTYPESPRGPITTYRHIDTTRLLIQWAMVCVVVGGLVWTLGRAKPNGAPAPDSSGSVESD